MSRTGDIVYPFVQQRRQIRLADEQKIHALRQDSLAKRLMTVQVITQQRHPPNGIMRALSRQPALGGGRFAILSLLTVLRLHERRRQGHHMGLTGRD
jgi:hypothetical protein